MEKISRIVRGSSRVASTDLKSAAAVRPGMPSFGRPLGESTAANVSPTTTAAKAIALHNEMLEKKKTGGDQVAQHMADEFFAKRIAAPPPDELGPEPALGVGAPEPDVSDIAEIPSTDELIAHGSSEDDKQPPGYKPRGSYVDVRA